MKNCTYVLKALICVCLFALSSVLPAYSQLTQLSKTLNVSNGDAIGFLEFKPADYDKNTGTKYPVIIFLHGIGERGNGTTELTKVNCCGIPRIIKYGHKMTFTWNGKTETFLVIAPQCPTKYGMWPTVVVDELVQYAKKDLRSDTNRIFLTGLSMGGGGTYRYISTDQKNSESIAAAATICAPCVFDKGVNVAKTKLPLWSFHAADDNVARAACTEDAINKINWANPIVKPLKTIWPTGGHIVWDRVYTDTSYKYDGVINIYEWFLGQNKSLPVNKLPVANAGNAINITTAAGIASLNATASSDADGKLVRYVWKKISGPDAGVITTAFGANASTTVTGLTTAGTYQYELSVVDNRAAFSKDTITVNVTAGSSNTPPNAAPVANAGNNIQVNLPNPTIRLNGQGSNDTDGGIATYTWAKISGPNGLTITNSTSSTPNVVGVVAGEYTFRLTVTDDKGASSSATVKVTVLAASPEQPAAQPVVTTPSALAGEDITVNYPENSAVLTSGNDENNIVAYSWRMISGPSAASFSNSQEVSTTVNNLKTGEYQFELTITDNKGGTSRDIVSVSVIDNRVPVEKSLNIFPNPSRTSVNVELNSDTTGNVKISVYNSNAMIVHSTTAKKEQRHFLKNINITNLQTGLYYLEVVIEGKQQLISKFVKQP